MQYTENITPENLSFDGVSGKEVGTFITRNLKDLSDNEDKDLQDLQFNVEDQTVKVMGKRRGDSDYQQITEFSVKASSSTVYQLELSSGQALERIIKKSDTAIDVSIVYSCINVYNGIQTQVANQKPDILLSVNGVTTKLGTGQATSAKTTTAAVLSIPTKSLQAGINNLSISLRTETANEIITSSKSADIKVYVMDMQLSTDIATLKTPLTDDTSSFTIVNSLTFGGLGSNKITDSIIKELGMQPIIRIARPQASATDGLAKLDTNYYNENGGIVSSYTTSISALKSLLENDLPLNRFYVQGLIKYNGITYTSQTVLYQLINRAEDKVAIAVKLEVNDIPISGNPVIDVNQYDVQELTVSAYNPTDENKTLNFIANSQVVGTQTLKPSIAKDNDGNVTSVTTTAITFSYPFVNEGNNTASITYEGASKLSLIYNAAAIDINTGDAVPENPVYEVSASGYTSDSDHSWVSNNIAAVFDNRFNWVGNGWQDGKLIVNNGATLTIPYNLLNNTAFTASFRYSTVGAKEEEALIKCYDNNTQTGFIIYPEKIMMQNAGNQELFTNLLSDGTIHEVTIVRYGEEYQYLNIIYIDGKAQAVSQETNPTLVASNVEITATHTTLTLYNVSLYNRALSFREVQNRYIFNVNNSSKIAKFITTNDVFNGSSITIGDHGQQVSMDKLPAGSAIMIIKTTDKDPEVWKTINALGGLSNLDEMKSWKYAVDSIKLIVKTNDGPMSTQAAHPRNFYVHPATISAQGTSSMSYPIKNYRIYFDKKADQGNNIGAGKSSYILIGNSAINIDFEYKVGATDLPTSGTKFKYPLFSKDFNDDYTSAAAKLFCLKADYADSSSQHNTGFARLVHKLMSESETCNKVSFTNDSGVTVTENSQTPPRAVVANRGENATYKKDIRTTIDGRPIYLYFNNDGTYVYLGKFNMNNEKKSEDVFGFKDIDDYFDNEVVRNEAEHLKTLFRTAYGSDFTYDANGNSYYDLCHNFVDDEDPDSVINPTECWEFSNNNFSIPNMSNYTNIGAFQFPYSKTKGYPFYGDSTYGGKDPFTVKDNNGGYAWLTQAWEFRFPKGDRSTDVSESTKASTKLKDQRETLHATGIDALFEGKTQPYLLKSVYKWLYKHNVTLYSSSDDKDRIANEFATDIWKYFNVNYLLKYHILTKWFGSVDQRVKNCMLAFWCDPFTKDNTDAETPTGHMRGFYIFYDNDTILGIDNKGFLTVPWDAKETWISLEDGTEHAYPGHNQHAIWDTLDYCYNVYINGRSELAQAYQLGKELELAYHNLRAIGKDEVLDEYLFNKYPTAIQNVDAEIKYYYPRQYLDLSNNMNAVTNPFKLACMQGSREFHQNYWLYKRTCWLDDKYMSGNYEYYKYKFKVSAEAGSGTDGGDIKLTSALDEWRFYISSNGSNLDQSKLLSKGETAILTISQNHAISVSDYCAITGLYGAKAMDLSDFNITSSISDMNTSADTDTADQTIQRPMLYMEDLIISNKDSAPKAFSKDAFSKVVNASLFPNLKTFVACNVKGVNNSNLGTLDLSKMYSLQKIDLRGTAIQLVAPNGNQLQELYLQAPTSLSLIGKNNLTTLSIADNSALTNLTITDSTSVVYDYAIATILDKYSSGLTANIEIGSDDNKYNMSETQYNNLLALAKLLGKDYRNSIVISGNVYCQYIAEADKQYIGNAFPKLAIDNQEVSDDSFIFTTTASSLKEGGQVSINVSKAADSWQRIVTCDNAADQQAFEALIEADSNPYSYVIRAKQSGDNKAYSGTIEVIATKAGYGEIRMANKISVSYVPITSLTLSTENPIVDGTSGAEVFISGNYGNTKSYLLTSSSVLFTQKDINGGTNSATFDFNETADEGITSIIVRTNTDVTISASYSTLSKKSNSLVIYADSEVTTNQGLENSKYHWIYTLLRAQQGAGANIPSKITRSYLHANLTLSMSQLEPTAINSGSDNSEPVTQDFAPMKYIKAGDDFNLNEIINKGIPFENLSLPLDTKFFTWTTTNQYTSKIKNINFSSNLVKALVIIDVQNSFPNDLHFDLSETQIRSINGPKVDYTGKTATNVSDLYSFVLSVTATNQSSNTTTGLFTYPETLTNLGIYKGTISSTSIEASDYPNGMFTLTVAGVTATLDGNKQNPIYYLPALTNLSNVTLGSISNYNSSSPFMSNDFSNVIGLDNTFRAGSNALDTMDFSNATFIGDYAFNKVSGVVTLGDNITEIGYSAFSQAAFTISNVSNVVKVGASAFWGNQVSQTLTFNALQEIGAEAFYVDASDSTNIPSHTIILGDTVTNLAYAKNSFGVKKSNTLRVLNSTLRNKLLADTELVNNVNITA